jgi:F-type H+-transporting ATPase subunit delta
MAPPVRRAASGASMPALLSGSARRYAEAVYEVARETGDYDQWLRAFDAVNQVLADPTAHEVFISPAIPSEEKWAALQRIFADQPEQVRNLLHILAERDRLGDLGQISLAFRELVDQERGVITAEVTTAVPLDAELAQSVAERLGRYLRHDPTRLTIERRVDPTIIGGVVARIGDTIIDDSVRGRIERLRHALTSPA